MKFLKSYFFITLFVITSSAHAAIIDNDLYTTDTITGLDWLDLSETNSISYNDIPNETVSGGIYEGWRYATYSEVSTMFSVVFNGYYDTSTLGYSSSASNAYANQLSDANTFLSLFDITENDSYTSGSALVTYTASYGFVSGSDGALHLVGAYIEDTGYSEVYRDFFAGYSPDYSYGWAGVYMVRDTTVVPVPAAVWLFASGLIGLVGFVRCRKA